MSQVSAALVHIPSSTAWLRTENTSPRENPQANVYGIRCLSQSTGQGCAIRTGLTTLKVHHQHHAINFLLKPWAPPSD